MMNDHVISIARTLYHIHRPRPRQRAMVQDGQPLTKRPPTYTGARQRTPSRYTVCSILKASEAKSMPGWMASPAGMSGERRIAASKAYSFRFASPTRPEVLDSPRIEMSTTSSRLVALT